MSDSEILLQLNAEILQPIIRQVVEETLLRLEQDRARVEGKLAYSEPEAARLLGLHYHQLRDERSRQRINASVVVGRRIRYLREDLIAYLMRNRTTSQ